MITAKEAERIAAERLREHSPNCKITSRGWYEDDEYYVPILSMEPEARGRPNFLVSKHTGHAEKFHYRPNWPIAARLKAMKRTKYLVPKVIISP